VIAAMNNKAVSTVVDGMEAAAPSTRQVVAAAILLQFVFAGALFAGHLPASAYQLSAASVAFLAGGYLLGASVGQPHQA